MLPEIAERNGTIFERENDLVRLHTALNARRSFLFYGPQGAGKTLLMTVLVRENTKLLYCERARSLDSSLRSIGQLLVQQGNRIASSKLNTSKKISATSLRGILRDALALNSYTMVLDHSGFASQNFVSGLDDIVGSSATPIVAVARSAHMEELGYLQKLFPFRSENIALNNFSPAAAQRFASWAIMEAKLCATNLDDFQERLTDATSGNPGAILAMIRMAKESRYRSGEKILFTPMYVDFRLRWEMPE